MDEDEARFLTGPEGAELLAAARAARDLPLHRRARALAGLASGARIRAALAQDDLRRRAATRCPHAERLLFTREALEQASAWPVSLERACRWPGEALCDLGAGIGLDALAAAEAGLQVLAYERDPVRARLLAHNAEALGLGRRLAVRVEDATAAHPVGPNAFLDPDRRPQGRRTRDPHRFEPPVEAWDALLARFERALVKLPPVLPGDLPPGPRTWVSLGGRARECRLLVGDWPGAPPRAALALPSGLGVQGTGATRVPEVRAVEPGLWLLDPDVSVILAGLVADLAAREGLAAAHPDLPYLLAEAPREAAPGHWVRVAAILPPKRRALDAWLAAEGVGRLTIRKRGVETPAADWRRRLRPRGPNAGTLVFTRDARDRWVVYAGHEPQG